MEIKVFSAKLLKLLKNPLVKNIIGVNAEKTIENAEITANSIQKRGFLTMKKNLTDLLSRLTNALLRLVL